jgi:hypothetical protein
LLTELSKRNAGKCAPTRNDQLHAPTVSCSSGMSPLPNAKSLRCLHSSFKGNGETKKHIRTPDGNQTRSPSLQPTALTTEISALQSTFNTHAFTSTYRFRLNCVQFKHATPNKQKKKSEFFISQLRSYKILAYFFRFQTFRIQSCVHWCINSEGICNTEGKDNRRH